MGAAVPGRYRPMQCPYCGKDHDKVVDSRSSEGGRKIRRRRECLECQKRFTTYEQAEEGIRLKVIKRSGEIEAYDRAKVLKGLQRSLYKRRVTTERILEAIEDIEEELLRRFDREVPSTAIGELVAEHLRELDPIAYVRFASVYREFADVGELIDEARQVEGTSPTAPRQRKLFEEEPPG